MQWASSAFFNETLAAFWSWYGRRILRDEFSSVRGSRSDIRCLHNLPSVEIAERSISHIHAAKSANTWCFRVSRSRVVFFFECNMHSFHALFASYHQLGSLICSCDLGLSAYRSRRHIINYAWSGRAWLFVLEPRKRRGKNWKLRILSCCCWVYIQRVNSNGKKSIFVSLNRIVSL